MKKSILALFIALLTTCLSFASFAYNDIESGAWYEESANELFEKGIMSGSDCWRVALAGAAVYVAAAEVMDTVGERMASGGRGRVAFAVNGLLLGLAGQAMNHIFF